MADKSDVQMIVFGKFTYAGSRTNLAGIFWRVPGICLAMMSTSPTMKAASCGTTLLSESSGQRSRAMPSSIQPRSS